jgi:acid phosphatase type 7
MDMITRRRALAVLLAPLAAAGCSFDSILSPRAAKQAMSFGSLADITLLVQGDSHTRLGVNHGSRAVAKLVAAEPNVPMFSIGDLAGEDGTAAQFQDYLEIWGEFIDRTWAALGNHDRRADRTARAYYKTFFGLDDDPTNDRAGRFSDGYYAMTIGTWRIYVMNSEHDQDYGMVTATGEQARWLAADLETHKNFNKGAFWHKPRFVSTGNNPIGSVPVRHFWDLLQKHRADWVVTGHTHRYERFARANQSGTANPLGIRQFIVGTGGVQPVYITELHPLSQKQAVVNGILRMKLMRNRYAWEFIDRAGVILDTGAEESLVTVV